MLNYFKNLFTTPTVKQTGFIHVPPSPTAYLGGTLPYEIRLENGNWKDYLPQNEEQYRFAKFDTMSCVSFSALNCLEMQLNYLLETQPNHKSIRWLYDQGYVFGGNKVNFSDRFIAILSGTTARGNTLERVADTIRRVGLIPEDMLPFGGETFEEYHGANITNQMILKGKEFLKRFEIGHEWVFWTDGELENYHEAIIENNLKQAPLQVAIPIPAGHALSLPNDKNFFDSYAPYYRRINKPINYGFKFVIVPKDTPKQKPFGVLKRGSKGNNVKELQKLLKAELPQVQIDGDFGPKTEKALKWTQGALNIRVDGIYGEQTKNALESKIWLPISNFSEPVDDIEGLNGILLCLVQRIRNTLKFPMIITSGKRTKDENTRAGGASRSSHLSGLAVDILATPASQDLIEREAHKLGINRVGRYNGHIHLDIDLTKEDAKWYG